MSVQRQGPGFPTTFGRFLGGTLGRYVYFWVRSGRRVSLREVVMVRKRGRERRGHSEHFMQSLKVLCNGGGAPHDQRELGLGEGFPELETNLKQLFRKYGNRLNSYTTA